MRVQIAAEEAGKSAKSCGIAVSLNEYERPDRRRGFHACIGAEVTPNKQKSTGRSAGAQRRR